MLRSYINKVDPVTCPKPCETVYETYASPRLLDPSYHQVKGTLSVAIPSAFHVFERDFIEISWDLHMFSYGFWFNRASLRHLLRACACEEAWLAADERRLHGRHHRGHVGRLGPRGLTAHQGHGWQHHPHVWPPGSEDEGKRLRQRCEHEPSGLPGSCL